MKHTITKFLILGIIFLLNYPLHGATYITTPQGNSFFGQSISAKAFDPRTGTLYLGLEEDALFNALVSTTRTTTTNPIPHFSCVTTSTLVANQYIDYINLVTHQQPVFRCNHVNSCALHQEELYPLLAVVTRGRNNQGVLEQFTQTRILALSNNGKFVVQSVQLNSLTGVPTQGIVGVSSNDMFVFAAIRPSEGDFGEIGGSITSLQLTMSANCPPLEFQEQCRKFQTLEIKPVANIPFDPTLNTVAINNPPLLMPNTVSMHFDEVLQRLYIGLVGTTAGGFNDGMKAVVVASVDDNGLLTFINIAPDSAFTPGSTNEIVGVIEGGSGAQTVAIQNMKVMHTSTGLSYLIVASGNSLPNNFQDALAINAIYALPLVDFPTSKANGTIAKKDAPLINGSFAIPATAPGDLPTTNDEAAFVGTALIPLRPNQVILPEGPPLSDMVVVGDTVYISLNPKQPPQMPGLDLNPAIDDAGILYSQAQFDQTGKIVRWTPWKHAFPRGVFDVVLKSDTNSIAQRDFEVQQQQRRIKFFEVDPVNGKITAVEGSARKQVAVTSWDKGVDVLQPDPQSLVGQLNHHLFKGCYSVLDLDQGTRGLGEFSPGRYTLFGGVDQVIFVRTTQANRPLVGPPFNINPLSNTWRFQEMSLDYSDDANFKVTSILKAGCVTSLEYSRREPSNGSQNYFFAGTENGLYVYAGTNNPAMGSSQGEGFPIDNTVNDLSLKPFSSNAWFKAPLINGAVLDIKTSGAGFFGALYVLTLQSTPEHPMRTVLYSVAYDVNITSMFSPNNVAIIATSGIGVFQNVPLFNSIGIISTSPDGSTEQLLLATSNGLYRSNASEANGNAGIIDAINASEANWTRVENQPIVPYTKIVPIDSMVKSTVWPMYIPNINKCNFFDNGVIQQINGSTFAQPFTAIPKNFIAEDTFNVYNLCRAPDPRHALTNLSYVCTGACHTTPKIDCFRKCNFPSCAPIAFDIVRNRPTWSALDPLLNFWSDGARRFFIVHYHGDKSCRTRLEIIPFNTNYWNVYTPDTQLVLDPVVQTVRRFNWVSAIGATGIIMAGEEHGIIALE